MPALPAPDAALLGLGALLTLGYAVQTAVGFGATILALALGAHLMPLPEAVALIVPASLLQNAWVAVRHRGAVDWRLLLGRVVPLMAVGLFVARAAVPSTPPLWLRDVFALLVLLLSALELWWLRQGAGPARNPLGWREPVALLGAGVVHGLWGTGGPLAVYALGRQALDKAALRSTLTALWLVMNALLLASLVRAGALERTSLLRSVWLLPAIPVGLLVGEWAHRRVGERTFRVLIFGLLGLSSVALLLR